jgi:ABC-type phosphate transport system auxiliary subunit
MTKDQEIAAIQTILDRTSASIQRLQAARQDELDPQKRADLGAQISALQTRSDTFQQALNNLQTTDDIVTPESSAG